jgi:hypothetical protein
MLLKALAVFQMLQVTLVSSEGLPRGRRTPGWSIRDDPEVINGMTIVERGNTPRAAWPKKTMAIDQASCSSKTSDLAATVDTIQNMVRELLLSIRKMWTNCILSAPSRQDCDRNYTKQFWLGEVEMVRR